MFGKSLECFMNQDSMVTTNMQGSEINKIDAGTCS